MFATTALISTVPSPSNLYHLALFICHLFIDGQFRVGQFFYEPSAFDGQLASEVASICPHAIPWQRTDITEGIDEWNSDLFTDNVLQLVIIDPEFAEYSILEPIIDEFQFYRMFILPINDDNADMKAKFTEQIRYLDQFIGSSSAILYHDAADGSIEIEGLQNIDDILDKLERPMRPDLHAIISQDQRTSSDNLFDRVFNQLLPILISIGGNYGEDESIITDFDVTHRSIYFANYYYSVLNAEYIEQLVLTKSSTFTPLLLRIFIPDERKYYNELVEEHIPTPEKFVRGDSIDLHFESHLSHPQRKESFVYPYYAVDLVVVFTYGEDYTRYQNILLIPDAILIMGGFIMLYIFVSAIVLYFFRKKFKLQRASVLSAFIDTLIPFIGGGNIQIDHKWEKWFFGILLIGSFFIVSLFAGDLLDCIYLILNQKITKFEQLAEIDTSLVVMNPFYKDVVLEMLRLKMKSNANFTKPLGNSEDSHVWVLSKPQVETFISIFTEDRTDYDILPEKLGTIYDRHFLESHHSIPNRLMKKFNRATSSMMESGLYQFYTSFAEYVQKLRARDESAPVDEESDVLTVQQLKRPMILIFGLWALAVIIFIGEHIVYKIKYSRNCRITYLEPKENRKWYEKWVFVKNWLRQ